MMTYNHSSNKKIFSVFSVLILGIISSAVGLTVSAEPVMTFSSSPRLIRSMTTYRNPSVLANYQFTLEIPSDAGTPLKKVKITQQSNLEIIRFFPEQTKAFIGQKFINKDDQIIPIESAIFEKNTENSLLITFTQGLEPGTTLTLSLRGKNPRYGGIYQFGITVFPAGNQAQPLYLGVGRIHFSQPGGMGS